MLDGLLWVTQKVTQTTVKAYRIYLIYILPW